MIQDAVPCEVQALLERQQLNGIPILLSTTSDLSLSGELCGHRIVVTRDNLAVVAEGAEPRLVNHLPLPRVDKFRARRNRLGLSPGLCGRRMGRPRGTRIHSPHGSICSLISWKTFASRAS